jgi:Abnormal spindle-like microcephaly-assoc'd, ASPM-SPD-2-Hydin
MTSTLSASPSTLSFGQVAVGGAASSAVVLSNTGTSAVSVTAASLTGSGFSLTGVSFPFSIAARSSYIATVNFVPSSAGTASGSIAFVSNAMNSPTSVTINGSGVVAPPHTVSLSWQPSALVISGYNIYRSMTGGGPYARLNAIVSPVSSYLDSAVLSGQTYYYVVTAVSSTGAESEYSNQVKAVIPMP